MRRWAGALAGMGRTRLRKMVRVAQLLLRELEGACYVIRGFGSCPTECASGARSKRSKFPGTAGALAGIERATS